MSTVQQNDPAKKAAEELWLKVLNDFDNETLHNTFIDYCRVTNQLPLAGEHYRTFREQRGDTPLIDRCMKKIVFSAQTHYLSERKREETVPQGSFTRLFFSALFLVSGFLIVLLWITFPSLRVLLAMGISILLVYVIYKLKRRL